jgi:Xaa-Pro aminopeptidase
MNIADLRSQVEAAAKRAKGKLVMLSRGKEPGFQSAQVPIWAKLLRGIEIINGEPTLTIMRMIKDADEVALHRKAIKITEIGLKKILPLIPRLKNESEIACEILKHYVGPGHEPMAFSSIVGCGINGATLHYPHNDQPLNKRKAVLIDSGATAGSYCADVTRTVPVSGKFTNKRFRELYELVLHCNKLGRKHARPGITIKELNDIAWQPILDAGLKRHHGLSHHIGMDVHDPSDYLIPLAPGMIISNEPGVYLADEEIGIRIEDDLLITATGCDELTKAIPKSIVSIEKLMSR